MINNYFSTDPNTGSYNGIIKIDHTFNAAHSLSVRYYGGTGTQAAVVDATAPFREYFGWRSHMHNVAVAFNSVILRAS